MTITYCNVGVVYEITVDEPAGGAERLANDHHRRNSVSVTINHVVVLSTNQRVKTVTIEMHYR